jgi:4-alpha-glucanotransferase
MSEREESMNSTIFNRRRAGLLLPVYALRHAKDLGIGDTRAVKDAIDFSAERGFQVLQMLPVHETFGDHSPYNPISSRALSPALLSITTEEVPGLTQEIIEQSAPESWLTQLRSGNVRHEAVQPLKIQILQTAAYRFSSRIERSELHDEFEAFKQREADWLESYTLFRLLIREYEGNTQWDDWRPEHRTYETASTWLLQHPARQELELLRAGFAFAQWVGWRQWKSVRDYADEKGILLLGEISFGVGINSADVWANPSLFDLEWSLGTPPLAHFDTNKDSERWGQNWGLPPYRWENHRSTSFRWLRGRVLWARQFFHGCRLDHLRGYFRSYMFPWAGGATHVEFSTLDEEEAAAKCGGRLPRFIPGPDSDPNASKLNELQGREIISQIIDAAGDMDLVAEIMGDLREYMERTLSDLQLANLSFPQLEKTPDRELTAPASLRELSLVAYANHDNAPLASLYLHLKNGAAADPDSDMAKDFKALLHFAGVDDNYPEFLDADLLRAFQSALFGTKCRLAVLMSSDLLGIPMRFNLPGSYGRGTWADRLELPLADLAKHPVYGPRIDAASALVRQAGRLP